MFHFSGFLEFMRIFRYLSREVLTTSLAILVVMLVIMLLSQASLFLGHISQGSLAANAFFKLMLLNIPYLCVFILPFAFFLGILIAYGRLYADSEMVVMQTSGFSQKTLTFYTLLIGSIVFLLMTFLSLYLNPSLIKKQGKILVNSNQNVLQTMIPNEFKTIDNGQVILYTSKITSDKKHLQNVFLAQLKKESQSANSWSVSYIKEASQKQKNGHTYISASDGYEYNGIPGSQKYHIMKYSGYDVLLPDITLAPYNRLDGLSTIDLLKNPNDLQYQGELQWRVSLILQIIILTLMAIPLSQIEPRHGRYGKILPAILFYFLYANLLFLARYLFVNKLSYQPLGLWWVHIVMLIIIGAYSARKYRWLRKTVV